MSVIASSWPTTIPLPAVSSTGAFGGSLLVSSSPLPLRRRRFCLQHHRLQVSWTLTVAQYLAFVSFFESDLCYGSSCFLLELRYPRLGSLSSWVVRFLGPLSIVQTEGMYLISASLSLLREDVVSSFSAFLVADGGGTPFLVVPGEEFAVLDT